MPPSPANTSCIALLVRHGATDNNVADPPLLQGRGVNLGLSAEGRRQAERTARFLAAYPVAALYSSPLLRAAETARWIARPHGLEVESVEALQEVDVGRWESRSWEEIARSEPETYRQFMDDATTFGYPEGENMIEVLDRVLPAMERIMEANLGRKIIVVSHNVVNRVLLAHLLGVPLRKARRVTHDNCGISVVEYREGRMKLVTLNFTFHLDASYGAVNPSRFM